MRQIDADALNLFEEDGKAHRYCFPCVEIIKLIDEAPSIDIVRCGECKWYDNREGCFFSTSEIDSTGFCSFGERRESDDN